MTKSLYQFLLILTLFSNYYLLSQEPLSSASIKLKMDPLSSTLPIVDDEKNINLFFLSRLHIRHLKLNQNFEPVFTREYERPPVFFKKLLGFSLKEDNSINLYFSGIDKTRFCLQKINPDGIVSEKIFDFRFSNEKFLGSLNLDGMFYVISYLKKSKIINKYSFDDQNYKLAKYDLSKTVLTIPENFKAISKFLTNSAITSIEKNLPNSIENASKYLKVYPQKGEIILTLDTDDNTTHVLTLGLLDSNVSSFQFKLDSSSFDENEKIKSNSFISGENLYKIAVSNNQLEFSIIGLENKKRLQVFSFSKSDQISFKNSPIMQEGTLFLPNRKKELDKSNEFLRKISKWEVGLIPYQIDDAIEVKIGGVDKKDYSGGGMSFGGMGPTYSFNGGTIGYNVNPVYSSYGSYKSNRSVYFKTLLNSESLVHIKGDIKNNVFDNIIDFSEDIKNNEYETTFNYDSFIIHGHYVEKENTYVLTKFIK